MTVAPYMIPMVPESQASPTDKSLHSLSISNIQSSSSSKMMMKKKERKAKKKNNLSTIECVCGIVWL